MNYEEDGLSHINIYSHGRTELGRLLSNFADTPFSLPNAGSFRSVEGYWYWLILSGKDKDGKPADRLRTLHGFAAKQAGRKMVVAAGLAGQGSVLNRTEGFRACIRGAFAAKIEQNPYVKLLLVKSTLPFAHYYVFGNKVVVPEAFQWQCQEWERFREVLKK